VTDLFAYDLVLKQTSTDDVVVVTREIPVPPGNALALTLTVTVLSGTSASKALAADLELSNDRANWSTEGTMFMDVKSLGYYSAVAPDLAARFARLKVTLTNPSNSDGVAVVGATGRSASL
jgi:hypothetical protein